MTTTTATLTSFLAARIAEDETAAEAATWNADGYSVYSYLRTVDGAHIARHDPARVLAECEAKRAIVESETSPYPDGHAPASRTLRLLGAIWSSHPDYRPEWRP